MRKEVQRRFLVVYRHFRHKKYGEPIPRRKKHVVADDEIEDMFSKDDLAIQSKIKKML